MATMKAVRMHTYGGPDVLVYEDVPQPTPAMGQVLVRVHAAGVGPWDGEVRRGEWRNMVNYSLPLILGTDVSGIVEAVGPDVTTLKRGDAVYGVLDMTLSGSNAEYGLGRADALALKPTTLNHLTASSLPVAMVSGQMMVQDLAQVTQGQKVLVLGGAGGVGEFAVQFARRAGASVIATSSARDRDYVRGLGADEVLDFHASRFEDGVRDVDAVLDTVSGNEMRNRAFRVLKPGGILVLLAADPSEEAARQYGIRVAFTESNVTTARLHELTRLLDAGAITPHLGTVLPLQEAQRAHEMLEGAPHPGGKIVLQIVDEQ